MSKQDSSTRRGRVVRRGRTIARRTLEVTGIVVAYFGVIAILAYPVVTAV